MSDAIFKSQSTAGGDSNIDNEQVSVNPGTGAVNALRQRVRIGGSTGTLLAEVSPLGALYVGELEERALGAFTAGAFQGQSITADSGTGVAPSTGLNDAAFPPAAGSVALLDSSSSHASWSVQVTGTWTGRLYTEVSIDGLTWIPVNSRQSAGGRLANNFTQNGLYRGTYGGMQAFRVRAVGAFTGTAKVFIVLGDTAAVFQNSDVVVQSEAQYYSSLAGLNSGWGVCSQEITLTNAATEYPALWMFNNDAAGGRVVYINKVAKGANGPVKVRRYRTGPGGTQMARTAGGTLLTINNKGNQAAAASAVVAYGGFGGTALAISNVPTYFEKQTFIGGNGSGGIYQGGTVDTDEGGSILIPPQTGMYWTINAAVAGLLGVVEVSYWDGTTLT